MSTLDVTIRLDQQSAALDLPIIVVVLGGGEGTIETIEKTIAKGSSCIFIKSTGRASDLFVDLLERKENELRLNASYPENVSGR